MFSGRHGNIWQTHPEHELNYYIGVLVDAETLYITLHSEQDEDRKKILYYLFKVVCLCIINLYTLLYTPIIIYLIE